MKKYLLLFLIGIASEIQAQISLQPTNVDSLAISIAQPCNASKIYTVFGTPLREEAHKDEAADGFMKNYIYEDLRLTTVNDNLYDFAFRNSAYEVCVYNRYKIRIGDTISKFMSDIPAETVIIHKYDNEYRLFFKIENISEFDDSSLIIQTDQSGKITLIRWYSPV